RLWRAEASRHRGRAAHAEPSRDPQQGVETDTPLAVVDSVAQVKRKRKLNARSISLNRPTTTYREGRAAERRRQATQATVGRPRRAVPEIAEGWWTETVTSP